jgi:hypothetical protein
MLTLASSAIYLAIMKNQTSNVLGGTFTFYLIATAWATARRGEGQTGIFDWAALLIPSVVGIGLLTLGLRVVFGQATSAKGVPLAMYFFMGSVMLLSAAGDLRMLLRGGVFGNKRIVRHLWRMCFGLFVATGSFFLGQQQVFPVSMQGSPVLLSRLFVGPDDFLLWRVWFSSYRKSQPSSSRVLCIAGRACPIAVALRSFIPNFAAAAMLWCWVLALHGLLLWSCCVRLLKAD